MLDDWYVRANEAPIKIENPIQIAATTENRIFLFCVNIIIHFNCNHAFKIRSFFTERQYPVGK